jgi:hypothetical protein
VIHRPGIARRLTRNSFWCLAWEPCDHPVLFHEFIPTP